MFTRDAERQGRALPMKRINLSALFCSGLRRQSVLSCLLLCVAVPRAAPQLPDVTATQHPQAQPPTAVPTTVFPHLAQGRFWISGQANIIFQANPPFPAKYSGPNSFQSRYNKATGSVITLYTGMRLGRSTEILADTEEAAGLGLSSALGIAGFTDLDAVRDPTLSDAPYLARLMIHHVFALSYEKNSADRGPLSVFSELPARRLELRAGRFAITDFFDVNSVGSDSHLQFMNWSIDQNGAYDFTADSRGYTWGLMAEYQCPAWGLRFAEALMPGPQNGGPLVWNLRHANTSNTEFELHRFFLKKQPGMIRLLSYVNHANMGIYQYAIDQYLAGKTPAPEIDDHPFQVTTKYGFGVNVEQNLTASAILYGRFGWNNGKTESWSFTEIDQTVSGGIGLLGHLWKRNNDRAGLAFASNAISSVHARYLALGGLGFVLGDGALKYARENLLETYYTAHIWRGFYAAPDLQYIVNPGFNQARGPVIVSSFRLHTEF